jgi:hypothetical protein
MAQPAKHERKGEKFYEGQLVEWIFPPQAKIGGKAVTPAGAARAAVVVRKCDFAGYWGEHGWIIKVAGVEHPYFLADEDEIRGAKT